jgi:hypothetical protein
VPKVRSAWSSKRRWKLTDPAPAAQVMLFAVPAMDALMQVFAVCRERLTLGAFGSSPIVRCIMVAHGAQRPFAEDRRIT